MPASSPATPDDALLDKARASVKAEYDVFAKPFIPSVLRDINEERPMNIIETEPMFVVNYPSYISTFAATAFLPSEGTESIPFSLTSIPIQTVYLTPSSYKANMHQAWRVEYAAKMPSDLFNAEVIRQYRAHNGHSVYSVCVPGLRENDPPIERGDTLSLRMPYFDSNGQLRVVHWEGKSRAEWTRVQYNATVVGVNRKDETVFLRVAGLEPIPINFGTGCKFNMRIPPSERSLRSQMKALDQLQQALNKCQNESNRQEDATKRSEVHVEPSNDWIRRMLFPTEADGRQQTKLRSLPHQRGLFDGQCNYEQLQAVDTACKANFGVLPFLISGIPGAGKTKTLVEMTLQLLNTTNVSHILVCAPSDQAADTLTMRLRAVMKPHQLLRMNGPQRADNEVPGELLGYCHIEGDMFYLPSFTQLMAYNVVVTSTRDASILLESRVTNSDLFHIEKNFQLAFNPEEPQAPKKLHWGALIVDEAAQATEADLLPALNVVMPPSTYSPDLEQPRFIMAGDENQLGPKTASKDLRYSRSLFSRLFQCPIYRDHPLSRSKIKPSAGPPVLTSKMLPMLYPPFVNLLRNYRSHPAILTVPSSLFYNDTLIPEAAIESGTPLQSSKLWQGKQWPVLFVPVKGKKAQDDLERDGGGWYNTREAEKACTIARQLARECYIHEREIAIIAPFAAQVKVIRNLARAAGLWDVNIGPLEAFQGLESKVVILCTTRTRERFLEEDIRRETGVIGLRKKMNVALTRAKDALFVLGSADILTKDPHWNGFLAFCWRNGLHRGKPFTGEMIKAFEDCKTGVLEKALRRNEDNKTREQESCLGGAAQAQAFVDEEEDQMWATSLGSVLDEIAAEDYFDGDEKNDEFGDDQGGDGEEGEYDIETHGQEHLHQR